MKKDKSYSGLLKDIILLIALAIIVAFCLDTTKDNLLDAPGFYMIIPATVLILLVFYKHLPTDSVFWVMIGGGLLKLCYIAYTAVWNRQHDVIDFGVGEGHAAYIEYFLNNRHLPDFDPRTVWGFFQPPLHHIVSAVWMWLQAKLGIAERVMQENVQVLTFLYMCIVMIVTYRIMKQLGAKHEGTLITMLIVSFHPMLVMLSGSINNDALALCLSLVAVYITLLWYEEPTFGKVILLGLSVGLAMFAKLTSGLIAFAIGFLMLYKFVKDIKKWKNYIAQFVVFGAITFPIGLFWPVRNMILWDMPINYIPEVGEQLAKTDFVSRVLDIRMTSVYSAMIANGDTYDEYNTLVQMMKSSLFGEYNYGNVSTVITPFATLLFAVSVVLALLALYATCRMIFDKRSMMNFDMKVFLGLLYISFLVGYLAFSLGYSNFSAEDFRYSAMAIIVEAIFLGLWADESPLRVSKITTRISCCFAGLSAAVYLLLGVLEHY